MTTLRTLLTLGVILGLAAVPAGAETYTFNETDDVWDNPDHWTPGGGPPVAGDTAVIPSGKTCRVEDDDQAAEVIQVYGTLGIERYNLTLGAANATKTSIINGTLYLLEFDDEAPAVPARLSIPNNGWVRFTGTNGLITARRDAGYGEGRITRDGTPDSTAGIILEDGVSLKGSIYFWCSLENNSIISVDHADDTLTLGPTVHTSGNLKVSGTGDFVVSAGLLLVRAVKFQSTTPEWILTGGEIEIHDIPFDETTFTNLTVQVTVRGGTFDINDPFSTSGELEFSGGTIELAQGKNATFDPDD